jgi:phosphotransferase family enzyme
VSPGAALPSEQTIARIVARAFPGRGPSAVEPVTGGLINTNLRLRVDGVDGHLLLRAYTRVPSACLKEIELYRLVSGSVPVPDILYADPQGDGEIGPHAILRWIEGITFRELKSRSDPGAIAGAAASIGFTLARIGSFRFERPGPIGPGLAIGPPFVEGPDPLPGFAERCLAAPDLMRRVDAGRRERIRRFTLERAPEARALNEARSLVHSDFNSPNIIVKPMSGRWEVAGIIDWEFAFSGSPLFDAGNFLRYERRLRPRLEPHFSRGYLEGGGELPANWRELARVIDLTALCEILTRPALPGEIVVEVSGLIDATLDGRDPP